MVLHGGGSRNFEIETNVQWPWPFFETDMKSIKTFILVWRYFNFSDAEFPVLQSI